MSFLEQAHVQGNVEREAADLDTLNHRSLGRSDRRFSAAFRTPAHQGATDSPGSEERFLTDRKLADFSRNVGGGVQLFRQALVITDLSRLFLVVVQALGKGHRRPEANDLAERAALDLRLRATS